jgi:chromosome partitioning protein
MGKTIVIANQKGGVGKTTTVINLANAVGNHGKKVLVIDMDPQGNSSTGFNVNNTEGRSVYDIIIGHADADKCIIKTEYENVHFLPSNEHLSGAQVELVNEIAREYKLKKGLEPIKENYDFIFIDTPPSLALLTVNALVAADSVLIPIQCEYYALEGIAQLLKTIKIIKQNLNNELYIEGVCLTMFDSRTNLSKEVMENVVAHFKEKTYKTIIPRNVKISEAPSYGQPIQVYSPGSPGSIAYNKLSEEFILNN